MAVKKEKGVNNSEIVLQASPYFIITIFFGILKWSSLQMGNIALKFLHEVDSRLTIYLQRDLYYKTF